MRLNTSHRSIKVEGEDKTDATTDRTTIKPEIGHTVEIGMHLIEAEEIMMEILDQTIGIDPGIIIDGKDTDKMIGMTIPDKITGETTIAIFIDKIMDEAIIENKDIEVQVGRVTKITTEIIQGNDLSEVEIKSRNKSRERQSQPQSRTGSEGRRDGDRSRTESRSRSSSRVSKTEIGLGAISAKSMITLQGNDPVPLQMKIQMA